MIKSMTGYGSAVYSENGKKYSVEIKSVNNRYSDISVKAPRIYGFLEDALRKRAAERIRRGKADIYVTVENDGADSGSVSVDISLAAQYMKAFSQLSDSLGIPCNMKSEDFLRIQDVFRVEKAEENEDEITAAAKKALDGALDRFEEMRLREGAKMLEDLQTRLAVIKEETAHIEAHAPEIVEQYRKRIEERVRDILGTAPYDETRLLTEAAVFSDRVNVNEEIVRLKSHISQFSEMLASDEPVGRKIDFLIQEMNRETNTIGSKSNDLEASKIIINIKAEIEKLREQIQNVE
mgnify:FL=1